MLAEDNRRTKLHEPSAGSWRSCCPTQALIEIEDAHHMDEASAELLAYLTGRNRRAALALRRRAPIVGGGFEAPEAPEVVRIELKPLAPQDALRLAQLATAAESASAARARGRRERSGGNPQFLRDLLRAAIESGGVAELPDPPKRRRWR